MGNYRIIRSNIKIKDVDAFKASPFVDEWGILRPHVDKYDRALYFLHDGQDHVDHVLLAIELAPFASKGDTLMVQDLDAPGTEEFEFDGDGRVYHVKFTRSRGDELTRDDIDG